MCVNTFFFVFFAAPLLIVIELNGLCAVLVEARFTTQLRHVVIETSLNESVSVLSTARYAGQWLLGGVQMGTDSLKG